MELLSRENSWWQAGGQLEEWRATCAVVSREGKSHEGSQPLVGLFLPAVKPAGPTHGMSRVCMRSSDMGFAPVFCYST